VRTGEVLACNLLGEFVCTDRLNCCESVNKNVFPFEAKKYSEVLKVCQI
jgi:hypothetical protein